MARIFMGNVQKSSISEYFDLYLSSAAARGVKDQTLQTYKNHLPKPERQKQRPELEQ